METSFILFVALMFILYWMAYYDMITTVPGEYQYITEKISSDAWEAWEKGILYKTYQICEEGKRCGWEKMKQPVYSTVCNDGHTKTEEHIVRIQ